jgi:hypothetical protein
MIAAVSLQLFAAPSHPEHAALIARVLAIPPGIPCPGSAMTSQGPATLAVPATPGTSPGTAVTMAAGSALAWIRMCKAITRHHPACCPYSTLPGRVIPAAGTGRHGPD